MKSNEFVEELLLATSTRDLRKVDYFIQCGVDPCTLTHDGTSAIHTAALLESPSGPKIIFHMLKYGADPNAQTKDGLTPLHIASMWGRIDTINILLDYGADPTLKDLQDNSALDYAEDADEKKDDCIDALTRYRPVIKFKKRTFKTKSRKSLDMIIGKNEFDSTLQTTTCNDTLNFIKHKKPFNQSIPILKNNNKIYDINSKSLTLPPKSTITFDDFDGKLAQQQQHLFNSIEPSPIANTTVSKFKKKSYLKESTPKVMSRIKDIDNMNINEVVNLNETLFQTCCEYLDQSIRETCKDITNVVTSTILDTTENQQDDDQQSFSSLHLTDSSEGESYDCNIDLSKSYHNEASQKDKENIDSCNETFWSVFTSPHINLYSDDSPITLRKRRHKLAASRKSGHISSPVFVPKGRVMFSSSSDSSSQDDKNSLNNFLVGSKGNSPQIDGNFGKEQKDSKSSSYSPSVNTTDYDDDLLIENLSKLLDKNPNKYHRIPSDLLNKISKLAGNKIIYSPTRQQNSNIDLAIDVTDFIDCSVNTTNFDLNEKNDTQNLSGATYDIFDLQTEQTIDYSNHSPKRNESPNISELIQYYENQKEVELEKTNNSCILNDSRKSVVEIEGLNTSGKLVRKYINFFDCTQKDFDDEETIKKRRESMQEFLNITIDYDWKDTSQLNATHETEQSLIKIPPNIVGLTNLELRERLIKHGENPGPISTTTRALYQRHLTKLEKNPERLTKVESRFTDYSYEMRQALNGTLSFPEEKFQELESEMYSVFQNPNKHTWREGLMKTSFNYILMDPRVTKNLPSRAETLSVDELFRIFVSAIFYIGKGKNSRPYEHFHEAVKSEKNDCKVKGVWSNKIGVIRDIWRAGYGVVSLHIFHNVIPVEAYTREGCMIEALSLSRLTNLKRGEFYGPASTWSMRKKRLLGIHLLKKALQIYIIDGERQIRQRDITKK